MMNKKHIFAIKLLNWFKTNKTSYPWRQTSDPYRILVSELLLRKTTRAQVLSVFGTFFSSFPNLEALACSSEDSIKKVIMPLGMEHQRTPVLKRLAQILIENYSGSVPYYKKQLMKLPNVGLYTANAVLCFAYNQDEPLLDTNVIRVVNRVFSWQSTKRRPREDLKMWEAVSSLIPIGKAKEFNWAILDFAQALCLPKNPRCPQCFLLVICDYGRTLSLTS
jgi:A/G-specific adenine glycosylase